MNNYLLETKRLNEEGFDYLNEVFDDLNADSLDDLYAYLHKLQDCTITINNIYYSPSWNSKCYYIFFFAFNIIYWSYRNRR